MDSIFTKCDILRDLYRDNILKEVSTYRCVMHNKTFYEDLINEVHGKNESVYNVGNTYAYVMTSHIKNNDAILLYFIVSDKEDFFTEDAQPGLILAHYYKDSSNTYHIDTVYIYEMCANMVYHFSGSFLKHYDVLKFRYDLMLSVDNVKIKIKQVLHLP